MSNAATLAPSTVTPTRRLPQRSHLQRMTALQRASEIRLARAQLKRRPPARSHLQRMTALRRANEIRLARAQLKRDLAGHRREFRDLVSNPPEWLLTAKVYELLLAVPKVGRVKAHKILHHQKVSPSKTFGGLTPRQRRELHVALGTFNPFRDR